MVNINFNMPILISEWEVIFKPFPFMKKKGFKHFLATNLIENSTSFSDEDLKEYKNKQYDYTLPLDINYSVDQYGQDMLRNFYIHKKKSWSFPEIEKVGEYVVYLPYSMEENNKKIFLIEESTGLKKKINENNQIYNLLQRG